MTSARPVLFLLGESSSAMYGQGHGMKLIIPRLRDVPARAVLFHRGALEKALAAEGIPIHLLQAGHDLSGLRNARLATKLHQAWVALRAAVWLVWLFSRLRPRAVYTGDIWTFLVSQPAARLWRIRRVHAVRGTPQGRHLWPFVLHSADSVIVLSREMRALLISRFQLDEQARRRIRVIYNPVALEEVRACCAGLKKEDARRMLRIPSGCFAVGQVGSICERKGQLHMIRSVIPALASAVPSARFYFIGGLRTGLDEAYFQQCLDAVKDLGLEELVTFTGYQADMLRWYRALDVVVLPSREEGMARAMLEALAFGVPVISTDVLSAREVLEENRCGVVVAAGDYPAFAGAISRLAEDAQLREDLSACARQTASRLFDANTIASEYERELCGSRPIDSARPKQ